MLWTHSLSTSDDNGGLIENFFSSTERCNTYVEKFFEGAWSVCDEGRLTYTTKCGECGS
jgi:hypothetical protein